MYQRKAVAENRKSDSNGATKEKACNNSYCAEENRLIKARGVDESEKRIKSVGNSGEKEGVID